MKLDKLVGERFREMPGGCVVESHAWMVRGGYMKGVTNGIFSQYPPLRRITRKLEQIIREEMDALEGQEVSMPVVLPGALWEESGRYDSVGSELLRFSDRTDTPMVLGMTHEEAAVQLVREYGRTAARYPFMIYQIQTKFRDEARPRGGLIRVREFTMKDAYSFHTSQRDLEDYYARCHRAYERIFARAGLPEVVSVASDSGMMGGSLSHEFMLLTPAGEDSVAVCGACGYRANVEAAACVTRNEPPTALQPLQAVETPDAHTIEALCTFLRVAPAQCCKAVVYQKETDGSYVVLFLRGDLEANQTKLTNFLGCNVRPAAITSESGLCAGFIGPAGLCCSGTVLYDASLQDTGNLVCGANREGFHNTGLQLERDCGPVEYHDFAKLPDGGACPVCGKRAIRVSRGVEVGNIFQLGTKYTEAMGMRYTDADGAEKTPVMGCYGIGVGRLAACVCEARHDDYGPLWPLSIAPWQVQLCCLRADDAGAKAAADALYAALEQSGVEVLYDDRTVSAGVMFADADLLGVPVRVIVSPRNCREGCCELTTRDKAVREKAPLPDAAQAVQALLRRLADEADAQVPPRL